MKQIEYESQTGLIKASIDTEVVKLEFSNDKGEDFSFKMTKFDAQEFVKLLKAIL